MKICRARPQLVFTFDNRFSSTGCAVQQSVRYIIFHLQASQLSATSHTGRKSCRVKSLYMKRFWSVYIKSTFVFSTRVVLYSNTQFTQHFCNRLLSSRACPLSLQYQAASSQARLRSCWALPPWVEAPPHLRPMHSHYYEDTLVTSSPLLI